MIGAVNMAKMDNDLQKVVERWIQPGAMDERFDTEIKLGWFNNVSVSDKQALADNRHVMVKDLLKSITTHDKRNEELHSKLRNAAKTDRKLYDTLKRSLACVTLSGETNGRHIERLSGLYQIDFDVKDGINEILKDEATLLDMRKHVGLDPYILFCALSPSGQGLKCAARIDAKFIAKGIALNKEKNYVDVLWYSLHKYFLEKYGLETDKGVKDIHKLCFIPYDTQASVKPYAKIFEAPERPVGIVKAKVEQVPRESNMKFYEAKQTDNVQDPLFKAYIKHFNSIAGWDAEIMNHIAHSPRPNRQGRGLDYMRNDKSSGSIGYTLFTNQDVFKLHVHSSSTLLYEANGKYNLVDAVRIGRFKGSQADVTQYIKKTMKAVNPNYRKAQTSEPAQGKDTAKIPHVFWYTETIGTGKSAKSKLAINEKIVYDYLISKGFCQIQWWGWGSKQVALVRIVNNICEQVEPKELRTSLSFYVYNLPKRITDEFTKDDLQIALGRIFKNLIIEEKIDLYMPPKEVEFVHSINRRNTNKTINFYFQNCWVEITKDSITKKDYKDLVGVIWRLSLIKSDCINIACETEVNSSDRSYLRRFFEYQCTDPITDIGDLDLHERLHWTMAYSMDQKREKNVNYIPFVTEANTDINARNGGTGKGILMQIIDFYRNTLTVNWDKDNRFMLSELKPWTDVIAIQEIPQNFDFDYQLFAAATDGLKVERKFKNQISISSDETPKIICNSNYPVNTVGGSSSERRLLELEVKTYFSNIKTPKKVLGTMLLDNEGGWSQEDWDLAHSTIFFMVQKYLNTPEPPIHNGNIAKKRRTLYNTMEGFPEWAESYFIEEDGSLKVRKFQVGDLITAFAEHLNINASTIKPKQLSAYLNLWMREKNYVKIESKQILNEYSQERKTCYILKKLIVERTKQG